MNYYTSITLNLFVLIPSLIGLLRFNKISREFYPFLLIVWLGCINEIFSIIIIRFGFYNIINFNIHLLFESLLLLWLFKNWHVFDRAKKIYHALIFIYLLSWIAETIFITKLSLAFTSYFRILYSFITVLLSVTVTNFLLMKEKGLLLKNSIFIICCAFLIFYTLTVLAEAFFAYGLKLGPGFTNSINHIIVFTNFFCNLIFALAILWMPKRQAFSLQF